MLWDRVDVSWFWKEARGEKKIGEARKEERWEIKAERWDIKGRRQKCAHK